MTIAEFEAARVRLRETVRKVQMADQGAVSGDEDALLRLAALSPLEYDRVRKDEARNLKVKIATLDREVAARRPRDEQDAGAGRALSLPEVEPWPEPVDGAALVSDVVTVIRRHIRLPPCAAEAIALWVLWAYLIDLFDIAARLALLSPEMRCGKTTLIEILSFLIQRALLASGITPSAIFRTIEAVKPTLLIDEADTFIEGNEELRGILNSGHTRATATIIRTVGDDFEPRAFSTWCPMVLAAIGSLPATIQDRSIVIPMQRKVPEEQVESFPRSGKRAATLRAELHKLAQQIKRWTVDHASVLVDAEPVIPDGLHDRAADNWQPLLAIADEIGGDWPERARTAATALSGDASTVSESIKVQLLADIRSLFEEKKWDRVASKTLCYELAAMEERPWAEWRKSNPMSPAQLARTLKPFGVSSRNLKQPDGSVLRGYLLTDFEEAFTRYVPSSTENPVSKRYRATSRSQSGDPPLFRSATEAAGSVSENRTNPAPDATSSAVAAQNPLFGEDEEIIEVFADEA
jgi:putative DNA primase/helicase